MAKPKKSKPAFETVGKRVDRNGKEPREIDIGNVKVTRTDGLYFMHEGGTFETPDGVKGSFGATVGGGALVVYVDDDGNGAESYEVTAHDIIQRVLSYRQTRKSG